MSSTQTTGSVSQSCGKVEISTDGVAWTDISGEIMTLEQPEQSRMTGTAHTLAGNHPIVKAGKFESMDLVFRMIYSETDAEAYQQARAIFEQLGCENEIYVRYSPRGGDADDERLQGVGPLKTFQYPNLDAASAGPIVSGFTVEVPKLDTTIVAS